MPVSAPSLMLVVEDSDSVLNELIGKLKSSDFKEVREFSDIRSRECPYVLRCSRGKKSVEVHITPFKEVGEAAIGKNTYRSAFVDFQVDSIRREPMPMFVFPIVNLMHQQPQCRVFLITGSSEVEAIDLLCRVARGNNVPVAIEVARGQTLFYLGKKADAIVEKILEDMKRRRRSPSSTPKSQLG